MLIEVFGRRLADPRRGRRMAARHGAKPSRALPQPRTVVARVQRARAREARDASTPLLERLKFATHRRVEPRRVLHGARRRAEERHRGRRPRRRTWPGSRPLSSCSRLRARPRAVADLYSLVVGDRDPAALAAPRKLDRRRLGDLSAAGPRGAVRVLPRRGPARADAAGDRHLAAVPDALDAEPEPRGAARPRGGRGRPAPRGSAGARAPAPGWCVRPASRAWSTCCSRT